MNFFDFLLIMAAFAFAWLAWFAGIATALWTIKRKAPAAIRAYKKALYDNKKWAATVGGQIPGPSYTCDPPKRPAKKANDEKEGQP